MRSSVLRVQVSEAAERKGCASAGAGLLSGRPVVCVHRAQASCLTRWRRTTLNSICDSCVLHRLSHTVPRSGPPSPPPSERPTDYRICLSPTPALRAAGSPIAVTTLALRNSIHEHDVRQLLQRPSAASSKRQRLMRTKEAVQASCCTLWRHTRTKAASCLLATAAEPNHLPRHLPQPVMGAEQCVGGRAASKSSCIVVCHSPCARRAVPREPLRRVPGPAIVHVSMKRPPIPPRCRMFHAAQAPCPRSCILASRCLALRRLRTAAPVGVGVGGCG